MSAMREAYEQFTALRAQIGQGAIDEGDRQAAEQEAFIATFAGTVRERDEARDLLREVLSHLEAGDLESNEMDPAAMPKIAALERHILAAVQGEQAARGESPTWPETGA